MSKKKSKPWPKHSKDKTSINPKKKRNENANTPAPLPPILTWEKKKTEEEIYVNNGPNKIKLFIYISKHSHFLAQKPKFLITNHIKSNKKQEKTLGERPNSHHYKAKTNHPKKQIKNKPWKPIKKAWKADEKVDPAQSWRKRKGFWNSSVMEDESLEGIWHQLMKVKGTG